MTRSPSPIRTVFFDMGNVLVQFSHAQLIRQTAAVCGCSAEEFRRFVFHDGRLTAFECGDLTEAEFIADLEKQFECRIPHDAFRQAFADIFTLTPGIVPLLLQLRSSGIRLILLSNTSVTHLEFVEQHFDVLNLLDDRVVSCVAGAVKPSPAIYTEALRRAAVPPAECFYTDDIQAYIDAAAELGIAGHRFTTPRALADHLTKLDILSAATRVG